MERAVRHLCPSWLRDETDDLVQTAMLRLRDKACTDLPAAYLYRTAHSVIVDVLRQKTRRQEVELPVVISAPDPDPEALAGGREIGRAIRECLQGLARSRRRAVTLYLHGHGVPAIAKISGHSRKKSENLTYRGLQDLRTCLESRGVTP